jgi:hypothetical protein
MFVRKRRDSYGSLNLSLDLPMIPLVVPPSPFASHLSQMDLGDLEIGNHHYETRRNGAGRETVADEGIISGYRGSSVRSGGEDGVEFQPDLGVKRRASRVFVQPELPIASASTSTLSLSLQRPESRPQPMRAASCSSSSHSAPAHATSQRTSRTFNIEETLTKHSLDSKPISTNRRASRAFDLLPVPLINPSESHSAQRNDQTVIRLVPSSRDISKSTRRMSALPPLIIAQGLIHKSRASVPITSTTSATTSKRMNGDPVYNAGEVEKVRGLTIPSEFIFNNRSSSEKIEREEMRKKRNEEREREVSETKRERDKKRNHHSSWGVASISNQMGKDSAKVSCSFLLLMDLLQVSD